MDTVASKSPASRLFTQPFIQRKHQSSASLQCMKWPVAHSLNSTWFWLELVGNCRERLKITMECTNIQFCERLGHGWQFHTLHWPLCGNSPGTGEFPAQMASNAENVSIWWRHHDIYFCGDIPGHCMGGLLSTSLSITECNVVKCTPDLMYSYRWLTSRLC